MQPYFFPYIGYFQCLNAVDKYILYHNLAFIKNAWINKNFVLLKQGKKSPIIIPVIQKSSFKTINIIAIDETQHWRNKLLNKVYLNYKKAPHFEETFKLVSDVVNKKYEFIHQITSDSIISVKDYLKIETDIVTENNQYEDIEKYFAEMGQNMLMYEGQYLERKVIRVLEICKRLNAKTFINAIGGIDLYKKDIFKSFGIDLIFIKTNEELSYQQNSTNNFIPNLSIIDVLMFNGRSKTRAMLHSYSII